jgi:hypothetical protein
MTGAYRESRIFLKVLNEEERAGLLYILYLKYNEGVGVLCRLIKKLQCKQKKLVPFGQNTVRH